MKAKEMTGFVKNVSHLGGHIMKRYVAPNGEVPLEELYLQYGAKYNLERGDSFITWLTEVKLRDKVRWKIVTEEESVTFKAEEEKVLATIKAKEEDESLDKKPSDMTIAELLALSVRKARRALPMVSDPKLLKLALRDASVKNNTATLCKLLQQRITELASQGIT